MYAEFHARRFPFTARAEIIQNFRAVVTAQVTEISSHGCYLEFVELEKGSQVTFSLDGFMHEVAFRPQRVDVRVARVPDPREARTAIAFAGALEIVGVPDSASSRSSALRWCGRCRVGASPTRVCRFPPCT